jgi:hypothetical protein
MEDSAMQQRFKQRRRQRRRDEAMVGSNTPAATVAYGLGWFSIALGSYELLATRSLARTLGMRGQEGIIRAYGVREIVKGIGILTASDPTPWLWGRVAGDALDLATLATAYYDGNPKKRNVAIAIANVAGVTALDVMCAQQLGQVRQRAVPVRDYSDRSGFPLPPEQMVGAASDFVPPPDFATPEALRPYTQ